MNPGGSVKDRAAVSMIEAAEKSGILRPGGTIVEASGGNTAIAVAMAASAKGYKSILAVPFRASQEKQNMIKMFGGEVILCPGEPIDIPEHYFNTAQRIAKE